MSPKEVQGDSGVLGRYGTWYQGDDDEFAHCLILRDGRCVRLFQGLQSVRLESDRTEARSIERLAELLDQIPADWPAASYQGYNFITDAKGPAAQEIAVYGVQAADTRPPGQYYAAPSDSEVGLLVKQIAKLD